jgi:tetratricopeptide (TPR) repeat protein
MSNVTIDWDTDLPPDTEEEYQALIRALRRTSGFGLLFVRCSRSGGKQLIERVREDLPQKQIGVLTFEKPIPDGNFYQQVETYLQSNGEVKVLFIEGLEYSLYEYEEAKQLLGWSSAEILDYSWKGVPRLLVNLNQQRERFRDNLNICLVFLVPLFVLKYLIHRAPDFFDWRSGIFELPLDAETVSQESQRILLEGNYEKYLQLTPQERRQKLLEIQTLLDEDNQTPDYKTRLFFEQGNLLAASREFEAAIASYDKAVEFKPDYHEAWYNRGYALSALERKEEAIASYNKAVEIKPDYHKAWNNRSNALSALGRKEEAIASYEKAIEFKPDLYEAWNNRGLALSDLGHYEEAIDSYEKAIEFKPDLYQAWNNRGLALSVLGRYKEAIDSFREALELKPDLYEAWNNQGYALDGLDRYEEAIASFDKALELKSDYHQAWYNRGYALFALDDYDEAITSFDNALELKPEYHQAWNNRGTALSALGDYDEAIASFDRALELKPDFHQAWNNRGITLLQMARYGEAISSFNKALELVPDNTSASYLKAVCYTVQKQIDKTIDSSQ